MKKTLIYVDTSTIGGCCDSEFQEWSLGLLSGGPGGQTFKIHFRIRESVERGRSPGEYIIQAYMKRLSAPTDNRVVKVNTERLHPFCVITVQKS